MSMYLPSGPSVCPRFLKRFPSELVASPPITLFEKTGPRKQFTAGRYQKDPPLDRDLSPPGAVIEKAHNRTFAASFYTSFKA